MSGLRNLLRLLKEALLEADNGIDARAVQRAANLLRGEMARKLTLAHYAILARVDLGDPIDPDETGRFLLYRRAALEYNGERWVGVHPLLWAAPQFKAALEAEKRAQDAACHLISWPVKTFSHLQRPLPNRRMTTSGCAVSSVITSAASRWACCASTIPISATTCWLRWRIPCSPTGRSSSGSI